jgi:hypothetical protein
MRFARNDPPRRYTVGVNDQVEISDCGRLHLDPDEQITFVTEDGGEYDVARKSWGFYATPSMNARLSSFGLRAVLLENRIGRYFVVLVERGHEDDFEAYRAEEDLRIVAWLDDEADLRRLDPQAG